MNKTVTVNIGGMVFHIEELAYDKMKKYLEAIRGYFTSSEGRDEIIQDIESRMAEMFTERMGTSRQVVTADDVEHVINTMGRPEQVAGEEEETTATGVPPLIADRGYRRLYRDPDDKVISGVCSGFSHYMGIDPIWLRLIFAVSVFISFGTTLLVYLLLVLIIPKAQSTAEKLEMQGKPVNISTIKKTVEDEVDDIKKRLSGDASAPRSRNALGRFFEGLGEVIVGLFKFLAKFIAFIVLFFLFMLIIGLFIAALSSAGVIHWADVPVAITDVFLSPSQRWLVIISSILLLGVPAIMLLYKLVKLVFNIKVENRYINVTAGILTALGFLFAIFTVIDISKEYRFRESSREAIPIAQPAGNVLYLDVINPDSYRDESYYDHNWEINDEWSVGGKKDTLRIANVKLDVVRADGDKFELIRIATARARDRKTALDNARSVKYEIQQTDSVVKVSENFILVEGDKFRAQKIQLLLKVPVGKSVHLGTETDDIIYDIKNVTNTWDGDMVGKTWTMTPRGLECIGCNLESIHDKHVRINVNGEHFSIDSNDTINWDDKDVKIRINDQGVIIDAKEKK